MLRGTQEKWSNIITDWYPREGRRNRGRQSKRWEDELKLTAGPKWRSSREEYVRQSGGAARVAPSFSVERAARTHGRDGAVSQLYKSPIV
ncbi:hypothetical protein EVAR_32778_1 [Eumeta japonica]|uniref:Uncharacterized protein n=1 Tax=Eumeta variegata TaxID=151549 RepID=A0A4C1WBI5_EUMVA|nr:hypothetical protein EVAR_32778_1 [Eumeta japonica]